MGALLLPTNPTEFWTMVAGVGTIVLAFLAWRGLHSLGLTKSDMLTRAMRDARECAVGRCEELARTIIPFNGEILDDFAGKKIPVFVDKPEIVRFDPDSADHLATARKWIATLPPDTYGKCIRLLNTLEGWAIYFTKGLADHGIAFGPCAPVFCSMVVQNYAILLHLRASDTAGKFPNAVELFKSWLEQLEHQKRGLREGDLLRELQKLQKRGGLTHKLQDPLGTKLET